jgi:hypothetical protein
MPNSEKEKLEKARSFLKTLQKELRSCLQTLRGEEKERTENVS